MAVRSEMQAQFLHAAQEQGSRLGRLTDDADLLSSGLDSLGFAIVAARIEGLLAVDPFTSSEDVPFPVTFGESVALYENAARP